MQVSVAEVRGLFHHLRGPLSTRAGVDMKDVLAFLRPNPSGHPCLAHASCCLACVCVRVDGLACGGARGMHTCAKGPSPFGAQM